MRRVTERVARGTGLLLLLVVFASCAGPSPVVRPTEFPLHTTDQFFVLHWVLERGAEAVRAVGVANTTVNTVSELTLVLFGLDKGGKIVSRGYGVVRPGFGQEPLPFTVELRPGGQEDRFELRVASFSLNGLRGR